MGTRGLTMVIENATTKVGQYGQWDHYPEGQGKTILNLLHSFDMKKFKEKVSKLRWLNDKEIEKVNHDPLWTKNYPYLSRDAGGEILNAIYNEKLKVYDDDERKYKEKKVKIIGLIDQSEFAADSLFCEWAYVIDLDKGTFEVYNGFNKTKLKKTERFAHLKGENEFHPVKHVITFKLNKLPTEEKFLAEIKKIVGED